MNEDKEQPGGSEGEDKTVFIPGSGAAPTPPPNTGWGETPVEPEQSESTSGSQDKTTPPSEEWSTVPESGGEPDSAAAAGWSPPPEALPGPPTATYASPSSAPQDPGAETALPGFQTSFAPRTDGKGIQVGDVLNHIFEVKRFIARGGMGEVFEGINVSSEERVAIKVMLPSLAADANVIAMFRKEARTLTKLQHEALVQYRVLAQEPQLGVLYIVTEYIDGTNLADMLGTLRPGPGELLALLRRLATGLRTAHALSAIHRDISPDNVLLADGRLDQAKIIDFGIAKDLDPGSATIVGEGFAGKLNYVAPEQLGDFGRSVGTWTDVYSLALVILAVAMGRNVQLGGSLVDAVDKRRAGVDLWGAPEELRPILEQMLRANPKDRLQTMDAVIAEIDRLGSTVEKNTPPTRAMPQLPVPVLAGGAVLVLLVLLIGVWMFGLGDTAKSGGDAKTSVPSVERNPIDTARSVIDSMLPSVSCTWLGIVDIAGENDVMRVNLTGVAGNPAAAQADISRALGTASIGNANVDFSEVAPITQAGCAALDAFRQIRSPDTPRLSVPQRKFEMRMQSGESAYAGAVAANALVVINEEERDFAILGIEPSGAITVLFPDRKAFERGLAESVDGVPLSRAADGSFRFRLDIDHAGWSGLLMISGRGPFPRAMIAPPMGSRGPDWFNEFVSSAAEKGWQADMVWFKTVDEVRE